MEKGHYIVEGKEIDLLSDKFNVIIILDACRYDIYKEVYKDYFCNSTLKKAISPATETGEWLMKIFDCKQLHEYIYINSNPMYNNRMINRVENQFFKRIDVWKNSWNEQHGTVHPNEINKAFHKAYLKWPNKKFILHYLQPHAPYIYIGGYKRKSNKKERFFIFSNRNSDIFFKILNISLGGRLGIFWRFCKFFGLEPPQLMGKAWYKYGDEGLRYLYKKNLIIALKYVKLLTESISANWLITADHGERLGEGLKYSHGGRRDKEVIEVPWNIIKN